MDRRSKDSVGKVSDALLSLLKSAQSNGFAQIDASEVQLGQIDEGIVAFKGSVIGTGISETQAAATGAFSEYLQAFLEMRAQQAVK